MAIEAEQVERALRLTCSERSAADEATILSWAKRVKLPEEVALEQLVASMELREYNTAHSVLFRQGDEGDALSGRAERELRNIVESAATQSQTQRVLPTLFDGDRQTSAAENAGLFPE